MTGLKGLCHFPLKQTYRIKTQIDLQDDGSGLIRAVIRHGKNQSLMNGTWKKSILNLTGRELQVFMPCLRKAKRKSTLTTQIFIKVCNQDLYSRRK